MKKKNWLALIVLIGIGTGIVLFAGEATAPTDNNSDLSEPVVSTTSEPSFDKTRFSLTDPASLWVIVNKNSPLPPSYVPPGLTTTKLGGQLRIEAAQALDELATAANSQNIQLKAISGYRSYVTQQSTYNTYATRDGQAMADTYSARPGHSEHQTGLAVDLGSGVCDLEVCFGNTPAGKWLADHAHEYGFIIRYPMNKQAVTGYQYEPWHLRYVGKELAIQQYQTGETMEEFFDGVLDR